MVTQHHWVVWNPPNSACTPKSTYHWTPVNSEFSSNAGQMAKVSSTHPTPTLHVSNHITAPQPPSEISFSSTYFLTSDSVLGLQHSCWVAAKPLKTSAFDWWEKTLLKLTNSWGMARRRASLRSAAEVWLYYCNFETLINIQLTSMIWY